MHPLLWSQNIETQRTTHTEWSIPLDLLSARQLQNPIIPVFRQSLPNFFFRQTFLVTEIITTFARKSYRFRAPGKAMCKSVIK
jgi:hypothetical protein